MFSKSQAVILWMPRTKASRRSEAARKQRVEQYMLPAKETEEGSMFPAKVMAVTDDRSPPHTDRLTKGKPPFTKKALTDEGVAVDVLTQTGLSPVSENPDYACSKLVTSDQNMQFAESDATLLKPVVMSCVEHVSRSCVHVFPEKSRIRGAFHQGDCHFVFGVNRNSVLISV